VNPAAASTFIVAGFPTSITAGTAGSFTVTAKDAFGNTATGYTGTVHFTSSDGQASLPANSTLTSGTGSFSATLKTAATQSITATDTVTSSLTGSETGISVSPAAAASFIVAGFPSSITAGTAGSFTVTATDAFGNTAAGYTGAVHFTSSDGQASLPANSTLTSGTGSFSATLKTAGTQSITATDTVTSGITGSETGITVNPAAAASFIVAGFPSPTTAGTAGNFTVTARDAFGNTATGYAGTVHFTSSDGQASLPANSTLTNGTGSFSATLNTGGTQSITATDTVTSSITGSQTGIVVNAPSADLSVSPSGPSSGNEGDTVTYTVTVNNAGPSSATGTTLTDTLGSLLSFKSATTSQGTFSASGGVITFSLGTIASGGSATVTISAQATEDGSTSNVASVTSSISDPNTSNNSGSTTTSFAEPAINVSGFIRTHAQTLTNVQVATFTHANAVEPTSAFSATINWGDGTTSAGTIGISGSTYTVTGSHTYSGGGKHTISTTVTELAQAVNKLDPGGPAGDVVLYQPRHNHDGAALVGAPSNASASSTVSAATSAQHSLAPNNSGNAAWTAIEQFFSVATSIANAGALVDSFFASNDHRDTFALLWAELHDGQYLANEWRGDLAAGT
jgi:uncharacterized repeat protein (TIGR01451 family)